MKSLKIKLIIFTISLMAFFGAVVLTQALIQVRSNLLEEISHEFKSMLISQEEIIKLWTGEKTRQITANIDIATHNNALQFLKQGAKAGDFYVNYIGFADGSSLFSDEWTAPDDYNVTERTWYKQAVTAEKPILTDPYIDADTKNLTITVAAPFHDPSGKTLKGVVGGDVMVTSLVKTILSQPVRGNGYFFMFDQAGNFIGHPDPALTLKPVSDIIPILTPERIQEIASKTAVTDVQIGQTDMLLSLRPVEGTDWYIAVVADRETILAPLMSLIRTILISTLVIFVLVILFSGFFLGRMLHGLDLLKNAMVDISKGDGDLTLRLSDQGNDEIGLTARAFNAFIDKLNHLFRQLNSDAGYVIKGVQKANGLVHQVADSSRQISQVSASNAASLRDMTLSIGHIADTASNTDQLAKTASGELAESSGQMQRLSESMQSTAHAVRSLESVLASLEKRSDDIHDITNVIREIADQTNLLALNAAIEAARAGESGRGFAVVADEVRKLAERTATATMDIADRVSAINSEVKRATEDVNKSVTSVDEGVTLMQEAEKNIQTIRETTNQMVRQMDEIVSATENQRQATTQIVSNSESLFDDVQSTLRQTCDALEELAISVNKMEEKFGQFTL